jgi:hypothetical protein
MNPMPPGAVKVAALHAVERAGCPDGLVEEVHLMNPACGDNDDGGKVALAGRPGVAFNGGLGATAGGSRKEREAEVHGGGVQRRSRRLECKAKWFIGVERGGLPAAGGREFRAEGRPTGFAGAPTFAPRQLGERQHEALFAGGQFAAAAVAVVTGDTLVEFVVGQEVEELGEDGATFVHKVKNRQPAVEHPRKAGAELKSKNGWTTGKCRFDRAEIVVIKTLERFHK